MASLQDYGIRFISHGEWSDPEIEWKKSKFQTLLFNYWDVEECTEYETLDHTDDNDLQELVSQLWELTPSGYNRPQVDYEWEVSHGSFYSNYDDADYYKEYGLSAQRRLCAAQYKSGTQASTSISGRPQRPKRRHSNLSTRGRQTNTCCKLFLSRQHSQRLHVLRKEVALFQRA